MRLGRAESARFTAAVSRHRLHARLDAAMATLGSPPQSPAVVVDRDAFDRNAADLVARAAGTPIRVATKSLRVPALVSRALSVPGFAGVFCYSLREALWLHEHEVSDDLVLGYPTADRDGLARLGGDEQAAAAVTLMVDDVSHLDLIDACRPDHGPPLRIALDVDAGLRLAGLTVGPRRSPLRGPGQVAALAREVLRRPGFCLVGVMTYEGQVAGVPDAVPGKRARSLAVRGLKGASVGQLRERRQEIMRALRDVADLEFFNAGGSGSVESSAADPTVTEVSAGSGLLVPALFDHYRSFAPRPAAYFGVPVVRRPDQDTVTVAGGGFAGSGPAGTDRAPVPWAPPGLKLTGTEGAGEVQTPLVGPGTWALSLGDLVWFRHAKAGELAEHTNTVHLLSGRGVVESVPTYRGLGQVW